MCVQAIPLILSAAGSAASMAAQQQQKNQQARIADETQRRQSEINTQAGQRVTQEIQKVAAANPDEERNKAQNDFMDALRKSKTLNGGADLGAPGATSDRFTADVGQARTAAGTEGRALAGNLAAIDAPTYARIGEARGLTDTATDLSLLGEKSRGIDFLEQLRAARAGGNPGLEALGSGLSAFGGAMASRATPVPPKKVGIFNQLPNQTIYSGSPA